MPTLFIDFETPYTKEHSLKRLTLRRYLAWVREHGGILGVAWAVDDGEIEWESGPLSSDILADFQQVANDPHWTVVAHNAAYDIRVWRQILGLPQPQVVRCTLEMAMVAWPNQPGARVVTATGESIDEKREPAAYSLKSLARSLSLGLEKLDMPDEADHEAMAVYCKRDVDLCRRLYNRALPRITPRELAVGDRTNAVRELWLEVDPAKVAAALIGFDSATAAASLEAFAVLGAGSEGLFGMGLGKEIRSVKPAQVKRALLDQLGFDTPTISAKKLNPVKVAESPDAARVLKATSEASKALSHKRRVSVFSGSEEVDIELGWGRAHTLRFSSPSVGKGLNLHNIPKHNKALAKAIRQMFRLPKGYVFVRGDLANVEYRVVGWLAKCRHIIDLFMKNPLADPYAEFWFAVTGIRITKGDPARQIAKAAVLGLGFLMGLQRWMEVLLKAQVDSLSDPDPKNHLHLSDFEKIADDQKWHLDRYARAAQTKTHAPDPIARVALGSWNAFQEIHPEIRQLAVWLEQSVVEASRALDPQAALDYMMGQPGAPDPARLRLVWEDSAELERSVRVLLGDWDQPSVTWRDIGVRAVGHESSMCMSSRQSGSKGYRPLTKNILIENVTQSAARGGLVKGQERLELDYDYPYQFSVHDEGFLIVPEEAGAILKARTDMLAVFGPGNSLGFDWSVLMNPDEINVSRSLFEVDMGKLLPKNADGTYPPSIAWWDLLEWNHTESDRTGLLAGLP